MRPEYTIREAQPADLPAITRFFREAYGPETVFQDPEFIAGYFARSKPTIGIESLIGVAADGTVFAHYGGFPGGLELNGRVVTYAWGANAYTLPEWRGLGVGRQIAEDFRLRWEAYGAIGFTQKTAEFYEREQFNVFQYRRFDRFVRALYEGVYEVGEFIGQPGALLRERFPVQAISSAASGAGQPLGTGSWEEYDWECPVPAQATTHRDRDHLRRRFFENPFMQYRCWAQVERGRVIAAIFTRRERLRPTAHWAERIVDLFGELDPMPPLLESVARRAAAEGAAYVDASTFGGTYDAAFAAAGYAVLRGDEAELLPQVTTPIAARENVERVCLFSHVFGAEIAALQRVHFTRADADRDRIARLWQLRGEEPS